ncbi:MAG TPA: hypothetical protein VFU43_29890 [Streptosporangiaceae bacterium]|nr:hypothetical protein [Streptosporangiaceae bacterium]
MSTVAYIVAGAPIGCALLTGLVSGCAHGPGLSESAERLHADTHALLGDAAERLGPAGARPSVLADLTRHCTEGRVRWEFRGRVPLRSELDSRILLDQATDVSLTMASARGYRLDRPPRGDGRRRRSFTMTRDAPPISMVIRLRGGRQAFLELAAATPCLSRR